MTDCKASFFRSKVLAWASKIFASAAFFLITAADQQIDAIKLTAATVPTEIIIHIDPFSAVISSTFPPVLLSKIGISTAFFKSLATLDNSSKLLVSGNLISITLFSWLKEEL